MKGLLSILGLFLPHFFAATLSRRKKTDKRMIKFFLPYGFMKKRMRYVFHSNVGNAKKDRGFAGFLRGLCPYGIVLWWDGGRDAVQSVAPAPNNNQGFGANELKSIRQQITSLRREVMDGSERLELLMLRCLDSGGGRSV